MNSPSFVEYQERYDDQKQRCLLGEFGLTPQYWMMYHDAVERQHKLHYSVNTNDYNLRLRCWENSLPYFFSMNKQNYARYGTFYCRQLRHLDETPPGAKEELLSKRLSVCRNDLNIGQSQLMELASRRTYVVPRQQVFVFFEIFLICMFLTGAKQVINVFSSVLDDKCNFVDLYHEDI